MNSTPKRANLIVIFCIFLGTCVWAQESEINGNSITPIKSFLNDSRDLDLDAFGDAGFEGASKTTFYDPDDMFWDNFLSSEIPGTDNTINALAVYQGKLFMGGRFTVAGTEKTSIIASRDGVKWESFQSVVRWQIFAMKIYKGELIIGGNFYYIDDLKCKFIAAWNGSRWRAFGNGVPFPVKALVVFEDKLIAAGYVQTSHDSTYSIQQWDGTQWSKIDGPSDGEIKALTVYNDQLIAGGEFDDIGGIAVSNIAAWDGTAWQSVGNGVTGTVEALAVLGNKLIVGGEISGANEDAIELNNIVSWDGFDWIPIGAGLAGDDAAVYTLETIGGTLYAGGEFSHSGADEVRGIAYWDETKWSPVGGGLPDESEYCRDIIEYQDGVAAGGNFSCIGKTNASNIAVWDNSTWKRIGGGMGGSDLIPPQMIVYDSNLIISKPHSGFDGVTISQWSGSDWETIGICSSDKFSRINAIEEYDNGIVIGGQFETINGLAANQIAFYDGVEWQALGSGVSRTINDVQQYKGRLYVAAEELVEGGVDIGKLGYWDGEQWSALNVGLGEDDHIYSLYVYEGLLVVGGHFESFAGVPAGNVIAFDGNQWVTLGDGIVLDVYCFEEHNGLLVAGGRDYDSYGDRQCTYSWDGTQWSSIFRTWHYGMASHSTIKTMKSMSSTMLLGGQFLYYNDDEEIYSLAVIGWDAWYPLGSALSHRYDDYYNYYTSYYSTEISDMEIWDRKLIIAGNFTSVSGRIAGGVIAWDKQDYSNVTNGPNFDTHLTQNYPNPFNPSTLIALYLSKTSHVSAGIYNILGQEVKHLVDGEFTVGINYFHWDGKASDGRQTASGIYFFRAKVGDEYYSTKMLKVR